MSAFGLSLPKFSTEKAVGAASNIPTLLAQDLPSVAVYGAISWVETFLHNYLGNMGYSDSKYTAVWHLGNGLIQTMRQDYLLGMGGSPSSP